ncbi:uncharacterized protein LOC113071095 [Carassius auratus]|uniref:Uncharacterized protein LOC113071095 n=1 Tax=Carassius auratus TaxID=7957 RepID=A0A6P6MU88_CARAU|nr:uncharacterized protein LOC113071095 [Carassius auratus]
MESGLTDDNLNYQTRGRQKKKLSRDERTEKSDKPTEAAPTVSIALAKAKAETDTWKVKCQYLQEKIEDLTKDRDFLRQQLSEAIKMDNNIPDRIKDKPADIPKRMKIDSEITDPWQMVKRYKSVLEFFKRGSNMAEAFRKYGVHNRTQFRNTIVQSAAIAELAIAAPEKYAEINEKQEKGEKLSNITQKCQDAIMADENIANIIQTMKTDGKLLPIRK